VDGFTAEAVRLMNPWTTVLSITDGEENQNMMLELLQLISTLPHCDRIRKLYIESGQLNSEIIRQIGNGLPHLRRLEL
jgi:hypothetical protein